MLFFSGFGLFGARKRPAIIGIAGNTTEMTASIAMKVHSLTGDTPLALSLCAVELRELIKRTAFVKSSASISSRFMDGNRSLTQMHLAVNYFRRGETRLAPMSST